VCAREIGRGEFMGLFLVFYYFITVLVLMFVVPVSIILDIVFIGYIQ